jgi:nucleotide-binding universal stress UspA family protein
MFQNILIPTDGSDQSQRAIRTGVELAKLHGGRITGIHVIPDYHLLIAYEGAFDPVTEERIEEEAKARADANHCDLILMTSHGRKGLAAVLLGSETRKVLTHAKVPVLVVR